MKKNYIRIILKGILKNKKAVYSVIPKYSYNKRNKSYPGTIEHLNPYCLDYGPPHVNVHCIWAGLDLSVQNGQQTGSDLWSGLWQEGMIIGSFWAVGLRVTFKSFLKAGVQFHDETRPNSRKSKSTYLKFKSVPKYNVQKKQSP